MNKELENQLKALEAKLQILEANDRAIKDQLSNLSFAINNLQRNTVQQQITLPALNPPWITTCGPNTAS